MRCMCIPFNETLWNLRNRLISCGNAANLNFNGAALVESVVVVVGVLGVFYFGPDGTGRGNF